MSEVFDGTVEVQDGGGNTTVLLDGDNAVVRAGDNGLAGTIDAHDAAGARTVHISGDSGTIFAGGGGQDGHVIVKDAAGVSRVTLSGPTSGAGGVYIQSADQDVGVNLLDVGRLAIRQRVGGDMRDVLYFTAGGTAPLQVGAEDRPGSLTIRNAAGEDSVVLDGDQGDLVLRQSVGGTLRDLLSFQASTAALRVGAEGRHGDIVLHDGGGLETVRLKGNTGALLVGTEGKEGDVVVHDVEGRIVCRMEGSNAALYVGSEGNEGDILVRDNDGQDVFHVDGRRAIVSVGAEGREGDIVVRDGQGRNAVSVDGRLAALHVGTEGNEGDILVHDGEGRSVFHMDGRLAALHVGAQDNEGDILVYDGEGRGVFHFNAGLAALDIGAAGNEGDVRVFNDAGDVAIHLDGATGVMSLVGADCAEDFAVRDAAAVEPGTVLVIDEAGDLRESGTAYDRRVAGVVSGAGSYRPGIRLDQQSDTAGRKPVALMGKVYCKVDAGNGAVAVGDLLTSAETPGHAMKAADPGRAFGAVIGKALAPLPQGRGLIPILVALQ